MTNLENPDGEAGTPVQPPTAGLSGKGIARRRFAKTSAGVAGVIATLGSRSAMAKQCLTPSAYCSGNTSHANLVSSTGMTPDTWRRNHSSWSSASFNGKSRFSETFPLTYRCTKLVGYSCFDVVDPSKVPAGSDPDGVAMYIMATLLNVRSHKITFLDEKQVKKIWSDYSFDGTYSPIPGKVWTGVKIVEYLATTMS